MIEENDTGVTTMIETSLYESIYKLPLSRFRRCCADKDLTALIVSGDPTQDELQEAWTKILQQFSEAIGSSEYKITVSLFREISILQTDIDSVTQLVDGLRVIQRLLIEYDFQLDQKVFDIQKELAKELNIIAKATYKLDPKYNLATQEELNKCMKRLSGLRIRLDLKCMAYEALKKKNPDDKEVELDHKYFDHILVTIYDRDDMNEDSITVSKFVERIKQYIKKCEALKPTKK